MLYSSNPFSSTYPFIKASRDTHRGLSNGGRVGANEVDGSVGTQEVKSDETFHIPIVDFGRFLRPSGPGDRNATAHEIVMAFKEVGYVPSVDQTKASYSGASPMQVCLSQKPWHWSRHRRPCVQESKAALNH